MQNPTEQTDNAVILRSLREDELDEGNNIVSVAFSTFMGLPDPRMFQQDGNFARARFPYQKNFAAEVNGKLVGLIFGFRWGRLGLFGPLAVLPEFQGRGIAQLLVGAVVNYLEETVPQPRRLALCTFPASPKHVHLYGKFGYYPGRIISVMRRNTSTLTGAEVSLSQIHKYTELFQDKNEDESSKIEEAFAEANRNLLDEVVMKGLDLSSEFRAVRKQKLGDILYLPSSWSTSSSSASEFSLETPQLDAFAVCHVGANTEANSEVAKVTFLAARDCSSFSRLLNDTVVWAGAQGAKKVEVGVNMGRRRAFETMKNKLGFFPNFHLLAMEKVIDEPEGTPGYDTPNVFACDDWR